MHNIFIGVADTGGRYWLISGKEIKKRPNAPSTISAPDTGEINVVISQ